jgi:hypothetical protein
MKKIATTMRSHLFLVGTRPIRLYFVANLASRAWIAAPQSLLN